MKKRIMAVVVTAAMVMGALAGCGSSSAKETQAPASTEAASETAAASETTGETEASDAASGDLTHVNVHRTWRPQTVYQRSGRYLLLLTARQRRLCNGS